MRSGTERHHTKDKGDLGVAMVIADLARHGISVCLPMSEHLPFDIVAVSKDMRLARVQVKYRSAKCGSFNLALRSCYSDSNGVHQYPINMSEIDAIAMYCPETDKCYYITSQEASTRKNLAFRITPSSNGQVVGIRIADNYSNPMNMWCNFTSGSTTKTNLCHNDGWQKMSA